jgi:hypothetical protein
MIEVRHKTTGQVLIARKSLVNANLSGLDLRYADLRGHNLSGADLTGANLSFADLSGATLRNARLRWAKLGRTNLRATNLSSANLTGASLEYADLHQANLRWANLIRADLRRAISLSSAILDGAVLTDVRSTGGRESGGKSTAIPKNPRRQQHSESKPNQRNGATQTPRQGSLPCKQLQPVGRLDKVNKERKPLGTLSALETWERTGKWPKPAPPPKNPQPEPLIERVNCDLCGMPYRKGLGHTCLGAPQEDRDRRSGRAYRCKCGYTWSTHVPAKLMEDHLERICRKCGKLAQPR